MFQISGGFYDPCYSVEVFNKIYEHCLQPVEGEEMWPVSDKPRPQAPGYVKIRGRPKKNDRKGRRQRNPSVPIKCPNMALPLLVPCVEIHGITNQVA
jgi:hypothetical protein